MNKVLVIGVLLASVMFGCSDPKNEYVGQWSGGLGIGSGLKDLVGNAKAKEGDVTPTAAPRVTLSLDLRSDGTCTMTGTYKGKKESQEGTWRLDEKAKTITLRMTPSSHTGGTAQQAGSTQSQENKDVVLRLSDDKRSMKQVTDSDLQIYIEFSKR